MNRKSVYFVLIVAVIASAGLAALLLINSKSAPHPRQDERQDASTGPLRAPVASTATTGRKSSASDRVVPATVVVDGRFDPCTATPYGNSVLVPSSASAARLKSFEKAFEDGQLSINEENEFLLFVLGLAYQGCGHVLPPSSAKTARIWHTLLKAGYTQQVLYTLSIASARHQDWAAAERYLEDFVCAAPNPAATYTIVKLTNNQGRILISALPPKLQSKLELTAKRDCGVGKFNPTE